MKIKCITELLFGKKKPKGPDKSLFIEAAKNLPEHIKQINKEMRRDRTERDS